MMEGIGSERDGERNWALYPLSVKGQQDLPGGGQ
jgi:hypothetical protein